MATLDELQAGIEQLLERGRIDQARRILGDAFALDPDDSRNLLLSARINLEIKDYEAARGDIAAVLADYPDDIEARLLLFQLQSGAGESGAAERTVIELLRENPDTGELYALYAQLMLHTLHIEKAGALAAEALRLDPSNRLARVVSLLVGVVEGRKADSNAELEELVRDDPEALHVAWSLVAVLQSEHRYGEALEVMRGILYLAPGDGAVVEAMIDLRAASHWSTIPLWPLTRHGWIGSGILWGIAIFSFLLSRQLAPEFTGPLVTIYIVYVVYSWVWPPLLKRWLGARGF